MAMLGSMEIVESLLMVKQETVTVEKTVLDKFLDFCLQWNPCDDRGRTPDTKVVNVPSDEFLVMTNKAICHPAMLPMLRNALG